MESRSASCWPSLQWGVFDVVKPHQVGPGRGPGVWVLGKATLSLNATQKIKY